MNEKKTDVHMYVGRSPPNENEHVGFSFIPQGNNNKKKKKTIINSYNLIPYHFHTKYKGKGKKAIK